MNATCVASVYLVGQTGVADTLERASRKAQAWPIENEIEDHDWSICERCGGTLLYDALGPNLGVMPDTDCYECDTAKKRFKHLWNYINGNAENQGDAWGINPWVYALTFERVESLEKAA